MAGIAIGETAVAGVQHTVEERDEFTGFCIAVEHRVDALQNLVKIIDVVDVRSQ